MKYSHLAMGVALLLGIAPAAAAANEKAAENYRNGPCGKFTVAVIPDTQNYVDYRYQKWSGFPFDGTEQFYDQMRYIRANARSNGGDIVFASHVGDVWQHYSKWMDPGHSVRGLKWIPNAGSEVARSPKVTTRGFEIPAAAQAFDLLDGALPFSVVPGNHDYDALWTDPTDPPRDADNYVGRRHVGGLTGYLSAFSNESPLFRGKDWYVGSHAGGADSAQIFTAGQCKFIHIGLQYHAPDSSLAWARSVLAAHPHLPAILTTHDYLRRDGSINRMSNPNNALMDPEDNDPQMIWDEFISQNDQIFMVLSGHVTGQGFSVNRNAKGNPVYQIMADYQGRGQSVKDAGRPQQGMGDGWMRLMEFDLDSNRPTVTIRTYSSHYKKFSSEMSDYAARYKNVDGQAALTDEDFGKRDDFTIDLNGFKKRFER